MPRSPGVYLLVWAAVVLILTIQVVGRIRSASPHAFRVIGVVVATALGVWLAGALVVWVVLRGAEFE